MWGSCTWKGTSDLMSDLEVVSFRPSPDQNAWTFGGAAPVMRIRTPAVLEVYTEDCFAGRVRSEQDLVSQVCEFPFLNPQTGPFPARCCRSATGTPGRARARPAGSQSSAR